MHTPQRNLLVAVVHCISSVYKVWLFRVWRLWLLGPFWIHETIHSFRTYKNKLFHFSCHGNRENLPEKYSNFCPLIIADFVGTLNLMCLATASIAFRTALSNPAPGIVPPLAESALYEKIGDFEKLAEGAWGQQIATGCSSTQRVLTFSQLDPTVLTVWARECFRKVLLKNHTSERQTTFIFFPILFSCPRTTCWEVTMELNGPVTTSMDTKEPPPLPLLPRVQLRWAPIRNQKPHNGAL